MKRIEVSSSMMNAIGYKTASKVLCVEFNSGSVYIYKDVPPEVFIDLLNAESHGQYLNEYIKDTYTYKEKKHWPKA